MGDVSGTAEIGPTHQPEYSLSFPAYNEAGKSIKSRISVNGANINLDDFHQYILVSDPKLDPQDYLISANTDVVKLLRGKRRHTPDDIDIKTIDATIIVRVHRKYWVWRWLKFPHYEKITLPVAVIKRNSNKGRQDAPPHETNWLSSIGLSVALTEKLRRFIQPKQKISPYIDNSEIISMRLTTKKPNFWLGLTWQHPRQEINLGFIWVEISLISSMLFFFLSLMAEAYHWADWLRSHIG
jgi:hypothetical protein